MRLFKHALRRSSPRGLFFGEKNLTRDDRDTTSAAAGCHCATCGSRWRSFCGPKRRWTALQEVLPVLTSRGCFLKHLVDGSIRTSEDLLLHHFVEAGFSISRRIRTSAGVT